MEYIELSTDVGLHPFPVCSGKETMEIWDQQETDIIPKESNWRKFSEGLLTKFRQSSGNQYGTRNHPGTSKSGTLLQPLGQKRHRIETKTKRLIPERRELCRSQPMFCSLFPMKHLPYLGSWKKAVMYRAKCFAMVESNPRRTDGFSTMKTRSQKLWKTEDYEITF